MKAALAASLATVLLGPGCVVIVPGRVIEVEPHRAPLVVPCTVPPAVVAPTCVEAVPDAPTVAPTCPTAAALTCPPVAITVMPATTPEP